MTPAALRSSFDVLVFQWPGDPTIDADWVTRLEPYMALGGGVIWEEPSNLGDIAAIVSLGTIPDRTPPGYSVTAVVPGLTDGITGDFENSHIEFATWDVGLASFIDHSGPPAATVALYGKPSTLGPAAGCMVITGPDNDFHAAKLGTTEQVNMYNLLVNELRWVISCPP